MDVSCCNNVTPELRFWASADVNPARMQTDFWSIYYAALINSDVSLLVGNLSFFPSTAIHTRGLPRVRRTAPDADTSAVTRVSFIVIGYNATNRWTLSV
jgi:hypothetical protein